MIHALLIVIVAAVLVHDAAELALPFPLAPGEVVSITLGAALALALITTGWMIACGRALDRSGSGAFVRLADTGATVASFAAVALHLVAIFGLGWAHAVRTAVGERVPALDELLAIAPPVALLVWIWAAYYPIDRRVREASLLRTIEFGVVPPLPTRGQYVLDHLRHSVLLVLLPVTAILAWGESVDMAAARLDLSPDIESWLLPGLHLAGIAAVMLMMPLAIRLLWTTTPLGEGPLRAALTLLCERQGVRCRDLLVWRTHSGMLNGAVMGVIPRARYILLTDTLLDTLPLPAIEAVMAHEVAHVRRHHLAWLMLSMIVSTILLWTGAAAAFDALWPNLPQSVSTALGLLAGLPPALLVFGWVSRRFEEQADAFAAQHLSGRVRSEEQRRDVIITAEAADTMSRALSMVSRGNHTDQRAFSFRHGSIAGRIERLARLVGRPAHALPIDRTVRWICRATILGAVIVAALVVWEETARERTDAPGRAHSATLPSCASRRCMAWATTTCSSTPSPPRTSCRAWTSAGSPSA
ncbi:MAG: M48 family metallopeptidase [Planctomycetota bacterium]|nr:M48 family metallopeptidase [Planctomycetota bacterium]